MLNIILFTIDMLRYDYIGYARNYKNSLTPNIDEISKEGITYSWAFSSGSTTPSSFPGILASVYPSFMNTDNVGITKVPMTLAECFKQLGYVTIAFNAGNPFLTNIYGYDRGFDFFFYKIPSQKSTKKSLIKRILNSLNATKLGIDLVSIKRSIVNKPIFHTFDEQIKKLMDILDEIKGRKIFLWFHVLEVHGPHFGLFSSKLWKRLKYALSLTRKVKYVNFWREFYEFGVTLVDDLFSKFINMLDIHGFLKNSILIITSDHGEEFLEHGNVGHHYVPYEELIHVPLIVYLKNEIINSEDKLNLSNSLISLVDIGPSILRTFLKSPLSRIPFVGKATLFGDVERAYVYSEGIKLSPDDTKIVEIKRCIRTKEKWFLLDEKQNSEFFRQLKREYLLFKTKSLRWGLK